VLISAAGFGMPGTLSRIAAEDGMGPFAFLTWRAGLGTVVTGIVVAAMLLRGLVALPSRGSISGRDRTALATLLLFTAVVNVAMFLAFTRTGIGVAMICFYTYPALVALGAARFLGDPIDRGRAAALALGFAGLGLVVAPAILATGASVDPIGVGLALLASALQATVVLLLGRGVGPVPTVVTAFAMNAVPALCYVALAVAVGEAPFPLGVITDRLALIVLFSGIVGAAIPSLANLRGIELIGASRTAILMLFETVVAVAMAAVFLGQRPSALQIVGGVCVLLSGAVLQLPRRGQRLVANPISPQV
jgi:DME family drug/metabolite transporter